MVASRAVQREQLSEKTLRAMRVAPPKLDAQNRHPRVFTHHFREAGSPSSIGAIITAPTPSSCANFNWRSSVAGGPIKFGA